MHQILTFNLPDYTDPKSCGLPNTTNGINIGSNNTYTFTTDGWLVLTTNVAGSIQYTSDKYTADQYSPFIYGCLCPNGAAASNFYPVHKGETVTKTFGAGNWRAEFYPGEKQGVPTNYCIKY